MDEHKSDHSTKSDRLEKLKRWQTQLDGKEAAVVSARPNTNLTAMTNATSLFHRRHWSTATNAMNKFERSDSDMSATIRDMWIDVLN